MGLQIAINHNASSVGTETPEYLANITQTGTDNPIVNVLKNTLGIDIVWTRDSQHIFHATTNKTFPNNYTFLSVNKPADEVFFTRLDNSKLELKAPDGSLQQTSVRITIVEADTTEEGVFSSEFNQTFN